MKSDKTRGGVWRGSEGLSPVAGRQKACGLRLAQALVAMPEWLGPAARGGVLGRADILSVVV